MQIVLIPGLLSDSRVWKSIYERLIDHFPVFEADVMSLTAISQMAEELLTRVGGPLIAVGHSMGGRIALEMARLSPSQVKGLVLANTGHHPRRPGEDEQRQAMIDLGKNNMSALADKWIPQMLDPERVSDAWLVETLRDMVLKAGSDVHERQIKALLERPDAGAYLHQISCPTLVLAARKDRWSPVAQHWEIAKALARSDFVVIENAGHFAPIEQAGVVGETIRMWLQRTFEQ